jgi:parallel beta-helix repeat protein
LGRRTQLLLLIPVAAVAFGGGAALSGTGAPESPTTPAAPEAEAPEAPAGPVADRCDAVLGVGGDAVAFMAALGPAETGCLRGGVHEVDDVAAIAAPDVVLTSAPGESATLAGRLWIKHCAERAVVEDLTLDGSNPEGKPSPTVNADGATLRGNEISNDHSAICVSVNNYSGEPPPRGVVIENNVIHDCGLLPATNHQHGIYVANAQDTVVRGNVIYGNADRGVQLYPDADDSVVTGNVIDGNGEGVIFGGGRSSSSDDNLVANNVITGSTIRWNIQAHWQGPVGSGNVARDNCVWASQDGYYGGEPEGSGIQDMDGARAGGNVVADPGYANPSAGNYRLNPNSPCVDVLGGKQPQVPTQPNESPHGSGGGSPCTPGNGGAGRRFLVGGQRRDRLVGGPGSDRLAGKRGGDKILGGKGGPDCLLGGKGPDRIRAVNGRHDIVKCGHGRDRATVERRDRVRGCERVIVRRRG